MKNNSTLHKVEPNEVQDRGQPKRRLQSSLEAKIHVRKSKRQDRSIYEVTMMMMMTIVKAASAIEVPRAKICAGPVTPARLDASHRQENGFLLLCM